jgi:transcriptional regulator with XRE-family HTH domain
MYKTFAKSLNYYLSLRGKSQQDIINDLGYSSSTVSQWCNGKNMPRMDRMKAIATYLGIDRTDLLKDPEVFSKENFTADSDLIAELLDRKPALYELFKYAITLSEKDLKLLTKLSLRLNELQDTEP